MGLNKCTKTVYLVASTTLLWIWQSAQPTFDKVLPFLDISENGFRLKTAASFKDNEILDSTLIIISVSEIIAMCVGVATMVSLYSLFWVCSEGNPKFWQSLAFIFLATLTSVGYGIHTVCVIVQLHISQDNPLYALLDFMHERLSHNMFQFGMFSLFLLVVWSEKPRSVKTTTICLKSLSTALSVLSCNCYSVLYSVGTATTALFMSIFSNRTETGNIALAFYISIFVSVYLFMKLLKYDMYKVLLIFGQYPILEFYVAVAMYGLPMLFIHSWFFM